MKNIFIFFAFMVLIFLFQCETIASEKTKEQCKKENANLRNSSALEGFTDGIEEGIDASKDAGSGKFLGATIGGGLGAAMGYVAGWWNGEDCNKYQSEKINNNSIYAHIAKKHFFSDSRCDVDETMTFYDNSIIYYDNKNIDIDNLRKIKEDACSRFSSGVSLKIKNDYIDVIDYENNPNIKLAIYDVDFNFYSEKKKQTVTGTTRVIIAITVDFEKIVGEIHHKI